MLTIRKVFRKAFEQASLKRISSFHNFDLLQLSVMRCIWGQPSWKLRRHQKQFTRAKSTISAKPSSSPFIYLFSEIALLKMLCFKPEFIARNKEQQNKWMSLAFTLHRDTFYDNFHLISTHKPRQITLEHANNYRSKCFDFLAVRWSLFWASHFKPQRVFWDKGRTRLKQQSL